MTEGFCRVSTGDALGRNSKMKRHAQAAEPIGIADLPLFTAVYPSMEAVRV